jgi:phosphate transport system protein
VEHIWSAQARLSSEVEAGLARAANAQPHVPTAVARPALDRAEEGLRSTLLQMIDLIVTRIGGAMEALETHDAEAARAVIAGDIEINALAAAVRAQVIWTIATQSPVARDLRTLLVHDAIAGELERIGDSIANVAKRIRQVTPQAALGDYLGIPAMGRLAGQMLADIGTALATADAVAARTVARQDDAIDAAYHRVSDELIARSMADPADFTQASRLLMAAHYLERIGDRVTNIAEDVVFLATGAREDLND